MRGTTSTSGWSGGKTAWIGVVILGALILRCPAQGTGGSAPEAPPSAPPSASAHDEAPVFDGPNRCTTLSPLPANPDLDERDRRFSCVRLSMNKTQVKALLGPPDDIQRDQGRDGTRRETWHYNAGGSKGSESVGYVEFNPLVTSIHTPIHIPRPTVHRASRAVASPNGMICELRGVSWDGNAIHANVTLRNTGKSEFRFRHDHTAIKFNLLVTLFDHRGEVFGEQQLNGLHSPYGDWIELVIPASGQSSESVTILPMNHGQILYLKPGRYSLQVAFPFENREYFASDRVPFVVPSRKKKAK